MRTKADTFEAETRVWKLQKNFQLQNNNNKITGNVNPQKQYVLRAAENYLSNGTVGFLNNMPCEKL